MDNNNDNNNENHHYDEQTFNMRILVDKKLEGWNNDYADILRHFSEFPHIKVEFENENHHWKGLVLRSIDFQYGLRPRIRNDNDNDDNPEADNVSQGLMSQAFFEQHFQDPNNVTNYLHNYYDL